MQSGLLDTDGGHSSGVLTSGVAMPEPSEGRLRIPFIGLEQIMEGVFALRGRISQSSSSDSMAFSASSGLTMMHLRSRCVAKWT